MSDVFVSYKAEDRLWVRSVVTALEADGLSVWWDAQIGGGAAWRESIEAELNAAKCVVVIWSACSVGPGGTFVRDEASRALERGVYLPINIDDCRPPLGFGETQALSLAGWKGKRSDARYQAVLLSIRAVMNREPLPAFPSSPTSPRLSRRTVIASGGVALAAAASVGGWALVSSRRTRAQSIAVLPFANLSGDPNQAYFSDGIAEEIRTALARLRGVTVIGRTSSEAVRNDDARSAAKKLGVTDILAGSIRQSPSTIRVTAELIDGRTGAERWSQNYDRSPGDAIKIQTDIAENVARAMSAALGTVARAAISVGGTQDAQAQNLVLQAHELAIKDTKSSLEQARTLLDRAIQLDPNYADAYARNALAVTRVAAIYASSPSQLSDGLKEALRLAEHAVSLAPRLETGHRALAFVYSVSLQIPRALSEARRAFEIAPSDANVLRDYSTLLSILGRSSEALAMSERVTAIDPLNPESYNNRVAILYNARLYSQAIAESERIRRGSPALFDRPILLAECLLEAGRFDDARRIYAAGERDHPFRLTGEAVLAIRQGDRATAMARFARLKQVYGDAENYQYAQIHAQLGDKEQAFRDLQRAWDVRDPGLQLARVDPWLDPLRQDPRFLALLRKMNFSS